MKTAAFKERWKIKSWIIFQICMQRKIIGSWECWEGRSCKFSTERGVWTLKWLAGYAPEWRERGVRMVVLKGADNWVGIRSVTSVNLNWVERSDKLWHTFGCHQGGKLHRGKGVGDLGRALWYYIQKCEKRVWSIQWKTLKKLLDG